MSVGDGLKNLTDEALMLQFASGETAAFERLFDRYERRVFGFIRRYINDDHIAKELSQETFIRVIGSANRYTPTAQFSTWVLRIARNLCTDHARKKRPEKERVNKHKEDSSSAVSRLPAKSGNADKALLNQEIRKHLEAAIRQLPEKQREVFIMNKVLNLSFREIASLVETSENTVKSRMRYALEALRLELDSYYRG